MASWLGACAKQLAARGVADAHAAARGGQGAARSADSDAPHPAEAPGPARLGAYCPARAGGALRPQRQAPAQRAGDCRKGPRAANGPPSYGGRLQPSTDAATERAARPRGQAAPQGHRRRRLRPGGGAWCVLRLARAQPPPRAAVWIEGGACADPRATEASKQGPFRPAAAGRRGAQPRGWEGVGPQAVGCGLLRMQQGAPHPFAGGRPVSPVRAQHRAPCRGEKKEGQPLRADPL